MNQLLFILLLFFSWSVKVPPMVMPQPQAREGLLVPVGGGYSDVYPGIVAAFLERAEQGHVRIVVLPSSYSSNAREITLGERETNLRDAEQRRFEVEEACKRAAPARVTCTAVIAPVFVRAEAEDPELAALFDDATGVFILGGDQGVAMEVLASTAVEQSLADLYRRGGVIAGTSAGGAVQSRAMIADYARNFAAGNSLAAESAELWNDERRGLEFGVQDAVLDQHFFQRGRLGRLLSTITRPDAPHIGVGVDAYTGLRIEAGRTLTDVFGLYTVAVLDADAFDAAGTAEQVGERGVLSLRNVLVHLLAPGGSGYDLATRAHTLAPPPEELKRTFSGLALPPGAGTLLLGGNLAPEPGPVWERFRELTAGRTGPFLVVAAGFPNDRPAQRAAEKVAKLLGGATSVEVVSSKKDAALVLDDEYAGIVVIGRDQSLIVPERLAAVRTGWLAGTPVLLDNAAAAAAGVIYSAHEPTPEEGEEAELAAQRSFLRGRTVLADGLGLVSITVEPQLLKNNRWGRLFSLAYNRPELLTLGLADDAAVEIGANGGSVIGDNSVVVLDFRHATLDWGANDAFVVANGMLDVFAPGDDLAPASIGTRRP